MSTTAGTTPTVGGLFGSEVRLSTISLVTLGMSDLVTTLMWLNMGGLEGNPLFARLAILGSIPFAMGKILFLALPVMVLEWARTQRPVSAELGTWIAFGLYAYLWIGHLLRL